MNARQFVDTNILMYAHDLSAGAKRRRARALIEELWQTGAGVVSTQILQELCVNLRRKAGPISFWDALVVQAAQASGAEVLYSEGLADGQLYGDVRVVNPVASGR